MSLLPISIFRNRPTTTPPIITPGDEFTVYQYIGNNSHILASGSYITYVIIAGGGGGGGGDSGHAGGGGGAGGLIINYLQYFSPGTYPIIVGSKGTGSTAGLNGGNGGNSTFNSLTAIGGGGGGGPVGSGNGNSGGSGGGGAADYFLGTGTSGQGNSGGNGAAYSAGGGGGFGGAGTDGDVAGSGDGGAGGAGFGPYAEGGGGGGETLGGNDPGDPYTVTTNAGVGGYGVAPFGPYAATSATGYGCGGGGGPPDASYSGGNGSPGTVILQVYAGLAPTSVTITSLSLSSVSVTWARATSAGISILIYQSASTPVTTGNTLIATGYSSPVTISGTANYYYAAVVIARYTSEISNSEYIASSYGGPTFGTPTFINDTYISGGSQIDSRTITFTSISSYPDVGFLSDINFNGNTYYSVSVTAEAYGAAATVSFRIQDDFDTVILSISGQYIANGATYNVVQNISTPGSTFYLFTDYTGSTSQVIWTVVINYFVPVPATFGTIDTAIFEDNNSYLKVDPLVITSSSISFTFDRSQYTSLDASPIPIVAGSGASATITWTIFNTAAGEPLDFYIYDNYGYNLMTTVYTTSGFVTGSFSITPSSLPSIGIFLDDGSLNNNSSSISTIDIIVNIS